MSPHRTIVMAVCGLMSTILGVCSLAQFNDERRRSDLSPIVLPGGSVIEFKSFESKALGATELYSVFLPPSYSKEKSRDYPVIYFLHGLNNDETSWTVERYGSLQNKLEELILSRKVPEFIMVHPRGDNSFWCNYADGSRNYEDLVTRELVGLMEDRYRARKGRENRAIAGISMGGYGALKIAMKHPELYAAAVGHSPIIFLGKNPQDVPENLKNSRYYQFFLTILGSIFGSPFRQELWDRNNPLVLAKDQKLTHLAIYFDYGTEDRYIPTLHLDEGAKALDRELTEANIPHVFKIHPGEPHGWVLVDSHIEQSLPFACRTFK